RDTLLPRPLAAPPDPGEKLSRPAPRQPRQRISLVAELKPLSYADTVQYISHRLEVGGRTEPVMFTPQALKIIHRASGGIPRLVNVICDKALVLGYGAGAKKIRGSVVKEVLKDWKAFQRPSIDPVRARSRVAARRRANPRRPMRKIAAAVAIGIVGAALLALLARPRDYHP